MIVRLNSSTARACAVMLLLVGSGLVSSIAAAAEVDRHGTFINKQCGGNVNGCGWCTMNGCYQVTGCNGQTCTIKRTPAPSIVKRKPPGTSPVSTTRAAAVRTGPTKQRH